MQLTPEYNLIVRYTHDLDSAKLWVEFEPLSDQDLDLIGGLKEMNTLDGITYGLVMGKQYYRLRWTDHYSPLAVLESALSLIEQASTIEKVVITPHFSNAMVVGGSFFDKELVDAMIRHFRETTPFRLGVKATPKVV